jgi:cytochrome c553
VNKSAAFIILLFLASISQVYSQTQIRKIVDLSISPVSAFKKYCTRCHGDEGSAYGKGFADLKDDSLRNIVEDMMFGPGGLNPDSAEVDAMVSYNKTFKNKAPFAAALNLESFIEGKENKLKIETAPGSTLETSNSNIKTEKLNNIWQLLFDPNQIKNVKISVKRNGTVVYLNFPEEMWTR